MHIFGEKAKCRSIRCQVYVHKMTRTGEDSSGAEIELNRGDFLPHLHFLVSPFYRQVAHHTLLSGAFGGSFDSLLSHLYGSMRLIRLEKDGQFGLQGFVRENILKDLADNTAKNKAGYAKLLFRAERVATDSLEWIWIDTCCTIQTHHQRQCPTERVAHAVENGSRIYIAF